MHPERVAPVRAGISPELGKASSGVSFLWGKGLCVYQLSPCRRNFTSPGQISSCPDTLDADRHRCLARRLLHPHPPPSLTHVFDKLLLPSNC